MAGQVYTHIGDCPEIIGNIEKGLTDYANAQDGQLLSADTIGDVLIKISHYLKDELLTGMDICPFATIFEKNRKSIFGTLNYLEVPSVI